MRTVVAAVFFCAVAVTSTFGQSVTNVTFLPATFYIGDVVEARVAIRDLVLDDVKIPDVLPDLEWVTVEEVLALSRPDGVEIRILFRPFFSGTRSLPSINLGALELSGLSVFVSSVLDEENRELEPMRDQLLLPGTRLIALILAGILILLPVSIASTSGFARNVAESIRRRYRERMPYRRMVRQLKQLEMQALELDGRSYYIQLLTLVRQYLHQRLAIAVLASTTGELPKFLAGAGVPGELSEKIIAVFRFGDLVKFANQHAGIEVRRTHLADIRSVALQIQKEHSIGLGA